MSRRLLRRIAATTGLAVVAVLLSPLSGSADAPPTELSYACGLKSSGVLRAVSGPGECTKNETLVTFKPGPVLLCIQPSGSARIVDKFSKCKPPATQLTVPPTSGTTYFCAALTTGVLRWVSDPSQCTSSEVAYQITPNDAAPTVASTSPSDGAIVARDTTVSITFSEEVDAPSGAFGITCGGIAQPFALSGLPGTTAVLDPDGDLPMGSACTVTTTGALVSDADTNDPPDTMAANHSFGFTVDAPPSFVSSAPATGASAVPVDQAFSVTFSEQVAAASTAFGFSCDAGSFTTSGEVTGLPGTTATVTPASNLPPTSACTLTVVAADITDVDTVDPPDAMVSNAVISFTTVDAAPSVISRVPVASASQVPTNTNVSVTWSEPVAAAAGAISLDCGFGPLAGVLSGSPGATTIFNPTADLPVGVSCAVTVDRTKINDVDGIDPPDQPAADDTFSFTTDARPALVTTTPADGATAVDPSADIVLGFSEDVTAVAAAFTLTCNSSPIGVTLAGSGTATLTLTPTSAPQTASCVLAIDGSQIHDTDAADPPDTLAGTPTISWTTLDLPPTVVATTPASGATDVTPGSNITISFSEAVDVASGGFSLECPTGAPIAFAVGEGVGNVWTLDPTGPLPQGAQCTVTVLAEKVTDDDLVDPPDAMTADHVFSFTVSANSAPTDLTLSPATVAENSANGTSVGTLSTTDPDVGDTFTYTLVSGTGDTNNGLFAINGATLQVAAAIDFETTPSLSVRIRTTDSAGLSYEEAFTITVTNVNEAPTDLALSNASVTENQPSSTIVGTLSATDPDAGDTHTFTLVAGTGDADNASFSISGTTLRTTVSFNYEAKSVYSVRVRATDSGTLTFEKALSIAVIDANDPPVAVGDSYSGAIGNTLAVLGTTATGPHKVLTGNVTIANDTDEDTTFPHTLSAVAETVTSTGGGTATINADGSFSFLPGIGDKNQVDAFSYKVTDGSATTTGTVQVGISNNLVWYVDSASAAPTHDGRSSSPLLSFTGINGAGGAGDADATGDVVFVYTGTGSYAGGLVLEGNQALLGQPHGLVVDSTTLVAAGGTNPVITNAAGAGLTLASGVDVQGVSISGASGDGIAGTSVATATVGTVTAVPVSGSGQDGIDLSGSATGAISIASSVQTSGTRSVSIAGRTGGTTTLSGAITGKGIELSGNSGATIALTGLLSITTTTTPAFSATGGGTVTSTNTASTLNATAGGRGLDVVSTTIGGAGLTFRSVSSNGAPNGIRLSTTGGGGLTVTGLGSTAKGGDASGGTIANSAGAGVSLASASNVSLNNMTISGTPNASGVDGTAVTNFAFTNGTVSGSGTTSHGTLDSNIAFNDNGATVNNIDGTLTVSNSKLLTGYQFGIDVLNNNGTISNLQLTNNEITSATALTDSAGSGIRIQEVGSISTVSNLTKGSISGNAITGFPNGAGVVLQGGNAAGAGAPTGAFGTSGTGNAVVVNANTIQGHSAANPMSTNCILVTMPARGTGYVDITNNGTIGTPLRYNTGNCISVNAFGDYQLTSTINGNIVAPQSQVSGSSGIAFGVASQTVGGAVVDSAQMNIAVQANTVSQTTSAGIRGVSSDHGTLRAKVVNNTVSAPTISGEGIRINSGNNTSSDSNVCLQIQGNTAAGFAGFTGIGLRKQGSVSTTNDFGIVGLSPSPASGAQMVTYVDGQNPSGGGTTSVSGDQYLVCTLPF